MKSDHSTDLLNDNLEGGGAKFKSHSLSGGERNNLFIRGKENYANITSVSGLDTKQDSRSFAIIDFDNDGWMDIALANTSNPRLQLYRNKFAGITKNGGKRIRLKLIGGNTKNKPSETHSNRDGYGAFIELKSTSQERAYQHQDGEGLSAQNTGYISFALASNDAVEALTVTWPSGKVSVIDPKLTKISNSSILVIKEP